MEIILGCYNCFCWFSFNLYGWRLIVVLSHMENESDSNNPSRNQNSNVKNLTSSIQLPTKPPFKNRINDFFGKLFNRKPVYIIKRNGVERQFYNLDKPETLPFDKNTFEETQIFIQDFANPWYVDFESIQEEYDFPNENTTLDNLVSEKHIYPSQKFKDLNKQTVIRDMYRASNMDFEKINRLLYAIGGMTAIILLLTIT